MGTELDNLDVFDEDYDKDMKKFNPPLMRTMIKWMRLKKKISIVIGKIEAVNKGVRAADSIESMLDH